MNMVIILEIVVGIVVLAAAVRFAVRDARQRRGVTGPEDTVAAPPATGGGEHAAGQHRSEVADHREGEEVAALSAPSTAASTVPEPPAEAR
ncbi:MAG: hypothetical protein ACRDUV_14165 [Pseudonocardiaceae bacterium]